MRTLPWLLAGLLCLTSVMIAHSPQITRAQQGNYNCADPDNDPDTTTSHDIFECETLKLIFYALDGSNWTDHTGWLEAPAEVCTWRGILCCPCFGGRQFADGNTISSIKSSVIQDNNHVNVIFLPDNNLIGALPPEIGNLSNLLVLDLLSNHITSIPDTIGNLTGLMSLGLGENNLTNLPASIGNLNNLTSIGFQENLIEILPSTIGDLDNLASIGANNNFLTTLPDSICNLSNLTGIQLQYNDLEALPGCFGDLTKLSTLYLHDNLLTGLPETFGNLTNLKNLEIQNNFITALPNSFGNLSSLEDFWANDNDLTLLPASFGNLTNLKELILIGNQLTTLPATIVNLTSIDPFTWFFGLSYNAIYITDPVVRAFLDSQTPGGWELKQTIPPAQVTGGNNGNGGALISWSPRGDIFSSGYYEVGVSTNSGGPYNFDFPTLNKSATSLTINGLGAGTFYFVVRMITPHHSGNRHDLTSVNSNEVSVSFGIDPNATDTPTPTATETTTHTSTASITPVPDLTVTETSQITETPTATITQSLTPPVEQTSTSTPQITDTATVTETPGSLTEFLANGDFEEADNSETIPANWTQKQALKDKRKCGVVDAPSGSCVYRFKGSVGENSQLIQTITNPPLVSGDTLTLAGFIKAGGSVITKVNVKVKYTNTSLPAGKVKFGLEQVTDGFQPFSALQGGDLQLTLVDTVTTIKVKLSNRSQSGKVQYDGLSLTVDAGLLQLP